MQLHKKDINEILLGSSLLGTGGGGRFELAKEIAQTINSPVSLQSIDTIEDNDLIITAFMVGGLKKRGDLGTGIRKSIELLKRILNKEISYLIPVEIGPTAVMNILKIASELSLPVLDGDLVGFRSAPEIYVEAITLNKINRLPIAAINLEGDSIILTETESIKNIERILRTFSDQSRSEVYVAGYPLYKSAIENYFGEGSLTFTSRLGKLMNDVLNKTSLVTKLKQEEINYIDEGIIVKQEDQDNKGFTIGKVYIQSTKTQYEIVYKNEYLVLLKNNRVLLTSPDSILLFDPIRKRGLNNSENNMHKRVYIFIKKAIPPWRTIKGKKLFSPKNLGFDYEQKLL